MWHEARRHEKKIRGIMVDIKRRAERRKENNERNAARNTTNSLQVFGYASKIYRTEKNDQTASEPNLVNWNGTDIDRFDIRFHIDSIDIHSGPKTLLANTASLMGEISRCNYERYRILIENEIKGVTDEVDVVKNIRSVIHQSKTTLMQNRPSDEIKKNKNEKSDWRKTAEGIVEKHRLCERTCAKYQIPLNDYHVFEAEEKQQATELDRQQRCDNAKKSKEKVRRITTNTTTTTLRYPLSFALPFAEKQTIGFEEKISKSSTKHRKSSKEVFGKERPIFITSYGDPGMTLSKSTTISPSHLPDLPIIETTKRNEGIKKLRMNLMVSEDMPKIRDGFQSEKQEKESDDEFKEFMENEKKKEYLKPRKEQTFTKAEKLKKKTQSLLRKQARIDRVDDRRKQHLEAVAKRERELYFQSRSIKPSSDSKTQRHCRSRSSSRTRDGRIPRSRSPRR